MDIASFIFTTLIASGIVSAIIAGIVTHLFNKRLTKYERIIEARRDIYTKINEAFSIFFTDSDQSDRQTKLNELLVYYRALQIWGSDDVVRSLTQLMHVLDLKNKFSQEEIDKYYKKLVIIMRRDLLGSTAVLPTEVKAYGRIS